MKYFLHTLAEDYATRAYLCISLFLKIFAKYFRQPNEWTISFHIPCKYLTTN